MIKAAGVLFIAPDGSSLFLKRSDAGDMAGVWCTPGGKLEGEETAEEAAKREVLEETGYKITESMVLHTRTVSPVAAAATAPASVPESLPGASTDVGATAPIATPPPLPPTIVEVVSTTQPEQVDFTTFLVRIDKQFEPKLDNEHTGYAWAPINEPPQPLHPGVAVAIQRLTCDELGVARMIAAGQLTSPQRYENVSLFALRITGTGTSYRKKHDEYVYRRPENYLTQDFLDRCNGLAVIMQHPKDDTLDSKEFVDRVVGMIMLPYIVGEEVWGVAKVYDDAAIKMMSERPLSTSPAVVFKSLGNTKLTLPNGSALLVEGKPILLDHLAICEHGVWDKGEGPTGVNSVDTRGDSTMADEKEDKKSDEMPENLKKKSDSDADDKKADADAGTTLDKILSCVDSLSKRMDAYDEEDKKAKADAEEEEKKKADAAGDPEEVVADKKSDDHKDDKKADSKKSDESEEKKEMEKKSDSADHVSPAVKKMIDDMTKKLPKQLSDTDFAAMRNAQARADEVFMAFGASASRPQDGEDLAGYRRRLASELKKHSTSWKDVDLVTLADSAFDVAERQVYADAQHAALHPTDLAEGQLREIRSTDITGRISVSFAGQPRAWMSQFQPHRRRLVGIRNTSQG